MVDERRTLIAQGEDDGDFSEEDLVADEDVLISITERGYIKRVSTSAYRTLGRGRKGVTGQGMRDEDEISMMFHARTLHTILFFSDRGKVYAQKVYQIPAAGRTDRGSPMVNVLAVEPGEQITATLVVPDFKLAKFVTMATVNAKVKRLHISDLENVRPSGLIAMNLDDDDELGLGRFDKRQ